jgi:integrase
LFQHRGSSRFNGEDERVFCHPETGRPLDPGRYSQTHKAALKRAKVDKPLRPFQGIRHSALTNDAASGMDPMALMTRAGHSSFKTTQGYIHLAGELFPQEVEQAAARKFGSVQAQTQAQTE